MPTSIFESLPSHTPRKTSKNKAILGSKRRDYRYGPIRIDWLDLESSSHSTSSTGKTKNIVGGDTMDASLATSPSGSGKEKVTRSRGKG